MRSNFQMSFAENEFAQTSLLFLHRPAFAQESSSTKLAPRRESLRKMEATSSLSLLQVSHPLLQAYILKLYTFYDKTPRDHLPSAWRRLC